MALLPEGWMTQPKIDEFAGLEYGQSGTLWPMSTVGGNALRPKPPDQQFSFWHFTRFLRWRVEVG